MIFYIEIYAYALYKLSTPGYNYYNVIRMYVRNCVHMYVHTYVCCIQYMYVCVYIRMSIHALRALQSEQIANKNVPTIVIYIKSQTM